jgi:hypothetical protein
MAPELQAITAAAMLGSNNKQADKTIGLAIAHSGDAADQLLVQAGHPQPLAIGLPVDLHVAMARAKPLGAGPVDDQGNIAAMEGSDLQGRGHQNCGNPGQPIRQSRPIRHKKTGKLR